MKKTRAHIYLLTLLAVTFAIYKIVGAWQFKQSSGLLQITPSDSKALITVAQTNHQSLNVGHGIVDVRLKPGEYKIIASDDHRQATANVRIVVKTSSSVSLNLVNTDVSDLSNSDRNSNLLSQLLPYVGAGVEYKITYTYQFSSTAAKATIIITAPSQQAKADALAWIKKVGFDPSQLNIQYIDAKP